MRLKLEKTEPGIDGSVRLSVQAQWRRFQVGVAWMLRWGDGCQMFKICPTYGAAGGTVYLWRIGLGCRIKPALRTQP